MIDVHTHILPLTDDGAKDFEEAIKMIEMAYRGGTNAIVLTPHCAPVYGLDCDADDIRRKFACFSEIVCEKERIPIRLYLGMEVLYEGRRRMKKENRCYLTANDSRYLLMEYMFDCSKRMFLDGIDWAREQGFVPIVAHPERYDCVQENWELIREAKDHGAYFQLNAGSLFGKYGSMAKRTAHVLLREGLIQMIASDAHNLTNRTARMEQTRIYMEEHYGRRYTKLLLHENPKRMINNQKLVCEIGEK